MKIIVCKSNEEFVERWTRSAAVAWRRYVHRTPPLRGVKCSGKAQIVNVGKHIMPPGQLQPWVCSGEYLSF